MYQSVSIVYDENHDIYIEDLYRRYSLFIQINKFSFFFPITRITERKKQSKVKNRKQLIIISKKSLQKKTHRVMINRNLFLYNHA